MDDKTLEYMEDRVKTGKALRHVINGLKKAKEHLEKEDPGVKAIHLGIGNGVTRHEVDVPGPVLAELLKENLATALAEAVVKAEDEYAKL